MNLTRMSMKLEHTAALRGAVQAVKGYIFPSFTVLSLILKDQSSPTALSILGPLSLNSSGQSLNHDEF